MPPPAPPRLHATGVQFGSEGSEGPVARVLEGANNGSEVFCKGVGVGRDDRSQRRSALASALEDSGAVRICAARSSLLSRALRHSKVWNSPLRSMLAAESSLPPRR